MKNLLFIIFAIQINFADIVTIGSCATQIVCELGDCDRITGTDKQSQIELQNPVKNIGYWRSINVETILQTEPKLIIASKSAGPPKSIQLLKSTTHPLFIIKKAQNWEDLMTNISLIASQLGKDNQGNILITLLTNRLSKINTQKFQNLRILGVYSPMGQRIFANSKSSPASFLIEQLGAINLSEFEGPKIISKEIALDLNPDAILMTERTAKWLENEKFDSINLLLNKPQFKTLKVQDNALSEVCLKTLDSLESLYYE